MQNSGTMQGTLWKWTNYLSGWQSRWFILDNGILSYYRSQEDVDNGCKGSIKMSVCDVSVHPTDPTRLDLIIPGEAHFYVKASTPQERQEWLIALGSCKAGALQNKALVIPEIPDEEIKTKKSELRLYCDLLMQQVYTVKSSVAPDKPPDIQQMNEATSLLRATCDMFISTLEECMQLMHHPTSPTQRSSGQNSPAVTGPVTPTHSQTKKVVLPTSVQRQSSQDSCRYMVPTTPRSRTPSGSSQPSPRLTQTGNSSPRDESEETSDCADFHPAVESLSVDSIPESVTLVVESNSAGRGEGEGKEATTTFFSSMKHRFSDVHALEDGGIPTTKFLATCQELVPFFDKLNSTAFAPIKLEFSSNLKKVHQKYSTDPDCFCTVQYIILYEIHKSQHVNEHSATKAVIWINRMIDFMIGVLEEYLKGSKDLHKVCHIAYSQALKEHHSYVVRGGYAVALKSVPSFDDFTQALSEGADLSTLHQDITFFLNSILPIRNILSEFIDKHSLNSIAVM